MPDQNLSGEFVLKEENSPTNKSTAHFYSNLSLYPENVVFENQDEDEDVVLLVRRDLITNVPWIIAAIIFILIPPIISALQNLFTPFFTLSSTTVLIGTLFYYLIVSMFVLIQFALWYFNVGLVTTKRVLDFDVAGILFKEVSETKLNLIEDVTYSQTGAVRSVFDYGDVMIQTAGTESNFEFDRAPQPARIVRIIGDLIGGGPN